MREGGKSLNFNFIYEYVCVNVRRVPVCAHTHVCAHMCVHTCGNQKTVLGVYYEKPSTTSFEAGCLTGLPLHQVSHANWPINSEGPPGTTSHLTTTQTTGRYHHSQLFTEVLRIWIQVFMPTKQVVYLLSPFPFPWHGFLILLHHCKTLMHYSWARGV